MSRPAVEGAWYGRSGDHFTTRGADVFRMPGMGWFARHGKRIRGPLSTLDAAMSAAERMLAEAAPADRVLP